MFSACISQVPMHRACCLLKVLLQQDLVYWPPTYVRGSLTRG